VVLCYRDGGTAKLQERSVVVCFVLHRCCAFGMCAPREHILFQLYRGVFPASSVGDGIAWSGQMFPLSCACLRLPDISCFVDRA
jgi:hypothetical protein